MCNCIAIETGCPLKKLALLSEQFVGAATFYQIGKKNQDKNADFSYFYSQVAHQRYICLKICVHDHLDNDSSYFFKEVV